MTAEPPIPPGRGSNVNVSMTNELTSKALLDGFRMAFLISYHGTGWPALSRRGLCMKSNEEAGRERSKMIIKMLLVFMYFILY